METLVGNKTCDLFKDSTAAVDTYEEGAWFLLLEHNPADIQRTRELDGRFVARSGFQKKNLEPLRQA